MILLCCRSQPVNSFGLAFSVLIARFLCRASFLNALKAACILDGKRSRNRTGKQQMRERQLPLTNDYRSFLRGIRRGKRSKMTPKHDSKMEGTANAENK